MSLLQYVHNSSQRDPLRQFVSVSHLSVRTNGRERQLPGSHVSLGGTAALPVPDGQCCAARGRGLPRGETRHSLDAFMLCLRYALLIVHFQN